MKNELAALATLAVLGLAAAPAAFAADIGISVRIGQPGLYGRVDLGRYPPPVRVVQRPIVIERTVVQAPIWVAPRPFYGWQPAVQQRQWTRHCGPYDRCGTPVYPVRGGDHRWREPVREWQRERGYELGHDRAYERTYEHAHEQPAERGQRWHREPH